MRFGEIADRKTLRFKASRRRRTSQARAMASPWVGTRRSACKVSRARVRP